MINFISKEILEDYKDKTCFLRVDLNIKEGNEKDSFRVDAIVPTLELLRDSGIKTVIASHRGRFSEDTPSLEVFADILSEKIGKPINFIGDNYSQTKDSESQFFLIENLRRNKGEEEGSGDFLKPIVEMLDFYIQDAFAVCHRDNASVVLLPKQLPSFGGLLLQKEINNLNKVMENYVSPFTVIVGGAKTNTKVNVLDNLWKKADHFLLGGGIANTWFYVQGKDIGDSIYDRESVERIKKYLDSEKVVLPADVKRKDNKILDIGDKAAEEFSEIIKKSKTVIWNGPLGYFEDPEFIKGSKVIAQAIADSDSFSVVGGGETTSLLIDLGLTDTFSFLSTGGGAMLDYLSGKKLPGLEVLDNK